MPSYRWTIVALVASIYSAFASTDVHLNARNSTDQQQQLEKRDGGRATYFEVGLGACGWNNVDSDFIVALNYQEFDAAGSSYPSPVCGRGLTIYYNGQSSHATVADRCPSCNWGDLDLSPGLFASLADLSVGTFQMTWFFDGDQPSTPTPSPTPSPSPSPSPSPNSSSSSTSSSTQNSSSSTSTSSTSSTPTSTPTPVHQEVFAAAPQVILNLSNFIMKAAHESNDS